MKKGLLLAAILLAVSFCFVSGAAYGEEEAFLKERSISRMDFVLLEAKVAYMMSNPTSFLGVWFFNDRYGVMGGFNGERLGSRDTEGKIYTRVYDTRGVFYGKSEVELLDEFKKQLEQIYRFTPFLETEDMGDWIMAEFRSKEGLFLGYFWEGEYHLREE